MRGRQRGFLTVGATVAALSALAASCGGSGYEYVSNNDAGIFMKVPDDWAVIDVDTDNGQLGRPGVPLDWVRVVDSSPTPGVANYVEPVPEHPVGVAVVEPVETAAERDDMNLQTLRTFALANYLDPTAEQADPLAINQEADGPVEVIDLRDISFPGGFHGQRIVFNLDVGDGQVVTIDQTAVVDPDTTVIDRLLIKCEAHCYRDRQSEIDDIVDSWTIDQED